MGVKRERIGIVGYGVVGQATAHLFQDVSVYDPPKGWDAPSVIRGCAATFVCVPTPTVAGSNDLTHVYQALDTLAPHMEPEQIVAIRSTVLPGTVQRLQIEYPRLCLAANPEFLRAHRAFLDAVTPYRVVIGADDPWVGRYLERLYRSRLSQGIPVVVTDSKTAEIIKYASNCFLAMKISFAEELRDVCRMLGVQYAPVAEGMALDPRIGGGDELSRDGDRRGFTDECLPKDTECFTAFVQGLGGPATMLQATMGVNLRILGELQGLE